MNASNLLQEALNNTHHCRALPDVQNTLESKPAERDSCLRLSRPSACTRLLLEMLSSLRGLLQGTRQKEAHPLDDETLVDVHSLGRRVAQLGNVDVDLPSHSGRGDGWHVVIEQVEQASELIRPQPHGSE